jgi:hypothetical protein
MHMRDSFTYQNGTEPMSLGEGLEAMLAARVYFSSLGNKFDDRKGLINDSEQPNLKIGQGIYTINYSNMNPHYEEMDSSIVLDDGVVVKTGEFSSYPQFEELMKEIIDRKGRFVLENSRSEVAINSAMVVYFPENTGYTMQFKLESEEKSGLTTGYDLSRWKLKVYMSLESRLISSDEAKRYNAAKAGFNALLVSGRLMDKANDNNLLENKDAELYNNDLHR